MLKFTIRALNKLKLLRLINFVIRVDGLKIPILGGLGYANMFGTEKWMNNIMQGLMKIADGCLLDVGVNIGQTLVKVKKVDRNFEYIGFEPNPVCVFYAEKLISLNQFPNTSIVPAGISSANEIVTLKYFSNDQVDSTATIVDNFRPTQQVFQEKKIVVLNNEKAGLDKKIGIVKIDVEGAEFFVLEGLLPNIRKDRPVIVIEILPVYNENNTDRLTRQKGIEKMLQELDYQIFKIKKTKEDNYQSLELITEIGIHSDLTHCDYIFVPSEKRSKIITTFE